jgi:uncharacterized membrane protein
MTTKDTKPLEPFSVDDGVNSTSSNTPVNSFLPSEDRMWSALAYWSQFVLPGVLPAILLLSDQTNKNKFVRYHAIHSLAFLILAVLYAIVITIVIVLVGVIVPCSLCLTGFLYLVPAIPLIWYGIGAFQGKMLRVRWLTRFLVQNRLI